MTRYRVSATVVIPTFNRPTDLKHTLHRVLPLIGPDVRLIVVDDASTDPAQHALLKELSNRLEIEVIRLPERQGCTRARTIGLASVETRYAILLDDDSYFVGTSADDLAHVIDRFDNEPRLAVQAFPCLVPRMPDSSRVPPEDGCLVSEFINCACAIRMEAIDEIGGYPSKFTSPYGEERDVAIRLLDGGWLIRSYASPIVIHEKSNIMRHTYANAYGTALNYLRFIWWYHPRWLAMLYSTLVTAKLLRMGFRRGESVQGTIDGLRDFVRERDSLAGGPRVARETLKLFHTLRFSRPRDINELHGLRRGSWTRVLLARFDRRPGSLPARERGVATPTLVTGGK